MAATYKTISRSEFEAALGVGADGKPTVKGGFHRLNLPGTLELAYGKLVRKDITLRIYSSIDSNGCRECGSDAIRVVLFWKSADGQIKQISGEKRVNRTQGWKKNLLQRISRWGEGLLGTCGCGAPLVSRVNKTTKEIFSACSMWPHCSHKRHPESK